MSFIHWLRSWKSDDRQRSRKRRSGRFKRASAKPGMEVLEGRCLPTGLSLLSSTLYGGAGDQRGEGVAISGSNVFVVGSNGASAFLVEYGTALGAPVTSTNLISTTD